ncbi:sensor histidine kinase [Paenibacillus koleovorans]|uniref:sensor histidine kinase n=1 Tax=Paenibacillus koleovorans TaxID=121608 RepID=UPI000FDB2126|nr:HAMP domain-containing sensor histidine kinase [Paenibacillus koleovorans]
MSLKQRLMVLSSIWLVFILVLVNGFTYFFVVNITTKSEKELMLNKARTILEKKDLLDPTLWSEPGLLEEFLVTNEMIRIIGRTGLIQQQVFTDPKLTAKQVVWQTSYNVEIVRINKERYLYVQVPILAGNDQVGVLELGRTMRLWNEYLDVLLTALTITSFGALVLSFIGALFYSRFIFKPIRHLLTTMQIIQNSGTFRKLDIDYTSRQDELGELSITFNDMIGKLEEHFLKQQQFLADASHELRTPLTIIESYANMLNRWASKDAELRTEAIEAISSETKRLKGMVTSLLQLVDSEAQALVELQTVELTGLIESVASSMELSFEREVSVVTDGRTYTILGVPEKLRQLFLILLDNAIKYSSKPITVYMGQEEGGVIVKIADHGIGVAASELPHLFDRFYRVDRARTRQTGGLGLGLAIAKQIVQQHKGKIEIDSEPGVGTTVKVKFMRMEEQ